MPRRNKDGSTADKLMSTVKIVQGGTSASAADQALLNLGGVPRAQVGLPSGPVSLNIAGLPDPSLFDKLPRTGVSIDGDFTINPRETKEYFITTFDTFTNYTVTPVDGSVEVDGAVIYYTAPYHHGPAGFTVNGRLFPVEVLSSDIAKPSITSPIVGEVNSAFSFSAKSSAFAYTGQTCAHQSSDWELSLDQNFQRLTASSYNNSTSLTVWAISGLSEMTTYYLRVRHRSDSGLVSPWSDARAFITRNDGLISKENQLLINPTGAPDEGFGWSVTYDDSGTNLYVASIYAPYNGAMNCGVVYVYTKDSSEVWSLQQTLRPFTASNDLNFGHSLQVSADGLTMFVGSRKTFSGVVHGGMYLFTRPNNKANWVYQTLIASPSWDEGEFSYFKMSLARDATALIVGDYKLKNAEGVPQGGWYHYSTMGPMWYSPGPNYTSEPAIPGADTGYYSALSRDKLQLMVSSPGGKNPTDGYIEHYTYSGGAWVRQGVIRNPDNYPGAYFGHNFSLSDDFTKMVVSALYKDNHGEVYVYNKTGSTWTLEARLWANESANRNPEYHFGQRVVMSPDGTTVYVGHPREDAAGSIYVYQKVSGVWTKIKTIKSGNPAVGDLFGRGTYAFNPATQELAIPTVDYNDGVGAISIYS